MYKIHRLICILLGVVITSNCFAQESKIGSTASGRASIGSDMIYAESTGQGSTKEEAEQAAYTYATLQIIKQMREISSDSIKMKQMWQGYKPPIRKTQAWSSLNGNISDKGIDEISLEKSVIEGYWEYINGVYMYRLRIVIKLPITKAE